MSADWSVLRRTGPKRTMFVPLRREKTRTENCPRSPPGTRNRNWYAKSYRAAWGQVCLGLRGAPKTLKISCGWKEAPTGWVEFKKCATHARESVRSHFSLEPCTRVVSRLMNELKTQTRATAQGPPHLWPGKRKGNRSAGAPGRNRATTLNKRLSQSMCQHHETLEYPHANQSNCDSTCSHEALLHHVHHGNSKGTRGRNN